MTQLMLAVGRGIRYLLVLIYCLCFLLWAAFCLIAASPAWSRWLLQHIAQHQKVLSYQVESGSLRDGIVFRHFSFHGKTFHLDAEQLLIDIDWAGLLRGELAIAELKGQQIRLVFTAPPSNTPVHLKTIKLPAWLSIRLLQGELNDIGIVKQGQLYPAQALRADGGFWHGQQLDFARLQLQHHLYDWQLVGGLAFKDQYPLQAQGQLRLPMLQQQKIPAVQTQLSGDLANLAVHAELPKPWRTIADISAHTTAIGQPYQAQIRWGRWALPWLASQQLSSNHGRLLIDGNSHQSYLLWDSQLQGKYVPQGDYRAWAVTNWHSLTFLPFEARTVLGGRLQVTGTVEWKPQLAWELDSDWYRVNLARQWPRLAPYVPRLTGQLKTWGNTTAQHSQMQLDARWQQGEQWHVQAKNPQGWLWQWQQPQQVQASWQNIARTIANVGTVQSQQGSLRYQGTPAKYQLRGQLALQVPKMPTGSWQIVAQGQRTGMQFSQLAYQGEAGGIDAQGQLSWQRGLHWQAHVDLHHARSDFWLPDWPADVSGDMQTEVVWSQQQRWLRVQDLDVTGQLKQQPLTAQGDVWLEPVAQQKIPDFKTQQLTIDWANNHMVAEGGLQHQQWQLTVDHQFNQLELINSQLQGRLTGVVQIQGAQQQPAIVINDWAENLQVGPASVKALSVSGIMPADADEAGFLQLSAQELAYQNRVLPELALVLEGSRHQHRLSWQVEGEPMQAEGVLTGGLTENHDWQGQSEAGEVKITDYHWQQVAPYAIHLQPQAKQLNVAAHCWQLQQTPAELCVQDSVFSPQQVHTQVALENLDWQQLQPLLPQGLVWHGAVEGAASVDWQAQHPPQLALSLTTRQGKIGLAQEDDEPLTLPYDRLGLTVKSDPDSSMLRLRFETEAPNIGQGYVEARLDPQQKPYTINGALVLEKVNLAILKPFFPSMSQLGGELNLAGGLSGPLTSPDFYGEFSLHDGIVVGRDAPLDWQHIELSMGIRGKETSDLQGQFMAGDGLAKITGIASWQKEPSLALHLTGSQLAIRQKPLISAKVNPDLNFTVKPYWLGVTGKVEVPQALFQPQALSDKAIPLSPDVQIIQEGEQQARARLAKNMQKWAIDADIDLLLGDQVQLKGFGLTSLLTGGLRLQQHAQQGMQANGEIELNVKADKGKEPKYQAYGQTLNIRKGQLLFAGSVSQPALNIEAIKTIDTKVVGVRVEGRANAPTVQLFSDSTMTQDEMLGYLLLGRPLYQEGRLNISANKGDNGLLASAALSLGIKGGQGVASNIGKAVGIDNLALNAEGSGDTTQFTVSGYLSPRLYLRYGVGVFTPVNKVTLRYKISQKLYLEAVSSIESALDLFYNIKF